MASSRDEKKRANPPIASNRMANLSARSSRKSSTTGLACSGRSVGVGRFWRTDWRILSLLLISFVFVILAVPRSETFLRRWRKFPSTSPVGNTSACHPWKPRQQFSRCSACPSVPSRPGKNVCPYFHGHGLFGFRLTCAYNDFTPFEKLPVDIDLYRADSTA